MQPSAGTVALVAVCSALLAGLVSAGLVDELAPHMTELGRVASPAERRRPIHVSEAKLRAVVESTNFELRQLKRDFMQETLDGYLRLKLDPVLGFEQLRDNPSLGSAANLLMAEELATIVIKKHVVQRRLLTGLKLAFTKFLPMQTLVNLYRRYKSFAWLKDQEQVELRPKFPGATEGQFIVLYSLIEMRARVRAADDVLALTSDNIRRVLGVVQKYLVENEHGNRLDALQLGTLARHSRILLDFYQERVLNWSQREHEYYESLLRDARPLSEALGGELAFVDFLDRLIDVEGLDIDLSKEARQLDYPPTITEQMLLNVQKRWVPWYVLKSVEQDRRLLIEHRAGLMHFVKIDDRKRQADLYEWVPLLLNYICRNQAMYDAGLGRGK